MCCCDLTRAQCMLGKWLTIELHAFSGFEIKIGMVFAFEELEVDSDTQGLLASDSVESIVGSGQGHWGQKVSDIIDIVIKLLPDGEAVINLKGHYWSNWREVMTEHDRLNFKTPF